MKALKAAMKAAKVNASKAARVAPNNFNIKSSVQMQIQCM